MRTSRHRGGGNAPRAMQPARARAKQSRAARRERESGDESSHCLEVERKTEIAARETRRSVANCRTLRGGLKIRSPAKGFDLEIRGSFSISTSRIVLFGSTVFYAVPTGLLNGEGNEVTFKLLIRKTSVFSCNGLNFNCRAYCEKL